MDAKNTLRAQRVMDENGISRVIVGAALKIHKSLGPGLLESAYKECLYYELIHQGLFAEKEKTLPLIYKNIRMECGYLLDIIVANKVIIEIKAVEALNDVHFAQLLTYLKLSKCKLGLLINFNVALIKDGIKRVANKL
jgi:GxxExxY protein